MGTTVRAFSSVETTIADGRTVWVPDVMLAKCHLDDGDQVWTARGLGHVLVVLRSHEGEMRPLGHITAEALRFDDAKDFMANYGNYAVVSKKAVLISG